MPKAIYQLPNIFVTYQNAPGPDPVITIPEMLAAFLLEAAKKRPSWEFKTGTHTIYHGSTFNSFGIWAHGRQIGSVSLTPRGATYGLSLSSDAIAANTQRGRGKWTSKLKVALDTFKKYFKEYTPEQNLKRIGADGRNKFDAMRNDQRFTLNRLGDELDRHVRNLPEPLSEAQKQALLTLGFPKDKVEELQQHLVGYLFAQEQCRLVDNGVAIYEHAGVYYASEGGKDGYVSYRNDSLPNNYREKLGLLKLVDKNIVVPNVGYRISDTEFYLLGEENVQQEAA